MIWQERLIQEAERIVNWGKGRLELHVRERDKHIEVSIEAGRRFDFKIFKKLE
jgi:hypothetical protein